MHRGKRFGPRAFRKIKAFSLLLSESDPLFTLNLRDPKNPKVAGVLKVPGVSTYLQDIGHDHVLAVGYGGDNDGLNWKTTVSLFDVSDFNKPQLAKTLPLSLGANWHYSQSEANNNHLAITYWGPAQMTAIPMSAGRWGEVRKGYEYVTKLMLINTAVDKNLSIHGEIDH